MSCRGAIGCQSKTPWRLAKKNKAEIVDLKFIDLPGLWQHFSIPATELSAELFEDGLGFDGSSIRGFQSINESDMILLPDADTAMMDPFTEHSTISFICNVLDAITREPYSQRPEIRHAESREVFKVDAAWPTPVTGDRRSSSLSLTACVSTRTIMRATIISTPSKVFGTRGRTTGRIWATRSDTKRATFPCRRWTSTRICAPRWC